MEYCDPALANWLADSMMLDKKYDQIENLHVAFEKNCGELLELRWLSFSAARKQGDFKQALRLVTQLIEDYPAEKDYWAWRARIYETHGQNASAIEDYKKVLQLLPSTEGIRTKLGRLLKEEGAIL